MGSPTKSEAVPVLETAMVVVAANLAVLLGGYLISHKSEAPAPQAPLSAPWRGEQKIKLWPASDSPTMFTSLYERSQEQTLTWSQSFSNLSSVLDSYRPMNSKGEAEQNQQLHELVVKNSTLSVSDLEYLSQWFPKVHVICEDLEQVPIANREAVVGRKLKALSKMKELWQWPCDSKWIEKSPAVSSWAKAQAKQGNILALDLRAMEFFRQNNPNLALSWLLSAAQRGNAHAYWEVAQLYESNESLKNREAMAVEAYLQAANRGYLPAEFWVGEYYLGRASYPEALHYFANAAASRFLPAEYRMATIFDRGLGVEKDPKLAGAWYRSYLRQVESSHAAGQVYSKQLSHAYARLASISYVEKNYSESIEAYQHSCDEVGLNCELAIGVIRMTKPVPRASLPKTSAEELMAQAVKRMSVYNFWHLTDYLEQQGFADEAKNPQVLELLKNAGPEVLKTGWKN